ncbi:MAG: hypothetical protein IK130_11830 [Oscillospiraceae bacterium]|nr:hypothetical protein [Oscillospiraceae bacterium]
MIDIVQLVEEIYTNCDFYDDDAVREAESYIEEKMEEAGLDRDDWSWEVSRYPDEVVFYFYENPHTQEVLDINWEIGDYYGYSVNPSESDETTMVATITMSF